MNPEAEKKLDRLALNAGFSGAFADIFIGELERVHKIHGPLHEKLAKMCSP